MSADNTLFNYVLGLGDNCLILGQRLSSWCGHGPVLEEDIALTNTALDLIGQARLWLSYAAEVEGKGRDEDKLAFLRDTHEYRNLLLAEQPNRDYAATLARQFYFDTWHYFLLDRLTRSSDQRVADIAQKSLKEVTYHAQRSAEWVVRLGDGTEESHFRMQTALDELWAFTGELFEVDNADAALIQRGIACDTGALREAWLSHVGNVFAEATMRLPSSSWMQRGGKSGRHTEHFGYLLAEMQFLQRAYPGAKW